MTKEQNVDGDEQRSIAWRSHVLPAISGIFWLFHISIFIFRPDFATLWTLFPFWALCLVFLFLSLFIGKGRKSSRALKHIRRYSILGWLAAMIFFSDETTGIMHTGRQPAHDAGVIRVVSLNCSVGTPEAAREVSEFRPDLVLLQESPSREEIQNLAHKLWGESGNSLWGVDGSILVHGKIKPLKLPIQIAVFATAARVRIQEKQFVAVSFRFMTPPFRYEIWSPSAWSDLAAHRQVQRVQANSLLAAVRALEPTLPILMAGDCNAPAGDAIFREFKPALHDAYLEGGVGWCNSFQNDFPVLRIDQVWLSHQWQAKYLVSRRTQNSDHRMVICDVTFREKYL